MFKRIFHYFVIMTLIAACFSLSSAQAARLYLDPATSTVARGDHFSTLIRIDPEGECINTAKVMMRFSEGVRAVDFSRGQSFLTLWPEPPVINEDQRTISFAGGLPGGYCGHIPGDSGESDILGKAIFRIPSLTIGLPDAEEATIVFLDETAVLLNDGLGTPAALTLDGARITIGEAGGEQQNEWEEELRADATAPEPFDLFVEQDKESGDYYIIFSTTDKQTGIDHYEVLEADEAGHIPGTNEPAGWVVVESPYILQDQDLRGIIRVKAVDNAGNDTIISHRTEELAKRIDARIAEAERNRRNYALLLAGIIALFLCYVVFRMVRFYRREGRFIHLS